ncbi:MAG: sugar ABC transporter permease [Ardenticatenaceae bacterium]|nr:sugar ABC transporter permease [Anaerolineales bacterium]MCB8921312.1 sugar ABC transporter permease [Ardenticatenaceae bacterium]MCB8990678.1 sugar ABC transporter permease [Ardenticatenaceae bacterium]MCB9004063.1 sugar ABC transporter permease [Ardenticatenaceae bacterium]
MTALSEKGTAVARRRRWKSMDAQEARLAWLLISPTTLIVFGLVLFPAFFSIWISFHDVNLGNLNDVFHAPFIGWDNYRAVFNDFAFKWQGLDNWGAAITSIVYTLAATILTLIMGLAASLVLNRPFRGRGIARAIFLFPYVAPIVSVAFVWRWLLDPRPSGVLNDILMRLSIIDLPKAYLSTRGIAIILVIIFEAWRYFPFAMLMILARLQAVDRTMYEAAKVDGANTWQQFWNVTLPELRYVMGAIFLLRLMWTFNKFDDIFLLTGGGFGTNVLPVLTYQFSFKQFNFGRGAATAMILLVILVIFMAFYVGIVMRNIDEE